MKILGFLSLVVLVLAGFARAQAPTATAQGQIDERGLYTVHSGDTLYGISTRYGVATDALISANNLPSGSSLFVGQVLKVPGQTTTDLAAPLVVARAGEASIHTVQSGDTLYSIARQHDADVAEIAALNGITDPSKLTVGQSLNLPGAPQTETLAVTSSGAQPSLQHEVLSGQTLFSIARQHQVEVSALAAANGISDPASLRVGQILTIPSAHGAPIAVASSNAPSVVTLPAPAPETSTPTPAPQTSGQGVTSPTITDPAQAEVVVRSGATTPIMLPSLPPRRGSKFHWPARGKILTRFGRQGNGQTADGIEIKVDSGAAITAAEDGVVAFAGTGVSGYGYLVLIKHADDYYTAYGQNSAVNVSRGDVVQRGDLIARAGNSTIGVNGRLHFEVRYREDPVNPIAYMVN